MCTKHTPGPWGLDGHESGQVPNVYAGFDIGSDFGPTAPYIYIAEMQNTSVLGGWDEMIANARLIAAAPELLAAAEAAKAFAVNVLQGAELSEGEINDHLASLTAAIARAEGRSDE